MDVAPISVDQYNAEIDEAMKRMDDGDFYTHEEVVKLSKSWLEDFKINGANLKNFIEKWHEYFPQ